MTRTARARDGAAGEKAGTTTAMRRLLLITAAALLLWALAVQITGGIAIETQWRLVSSRNPVRPLIAGAVLVAAYLAFCRRSWREDLGPLSRGSTWPPIVAATAAGVALTVGLAYGTRIAAGPDQSGYVSAAALFASGALTVEAPRWAQDAPWDDAAFSASPVGWHPTSRTHILAPTYSAGLPLIMAAAQRLAGPDAVFYVVPVLGVLLVAATYLLGSLLATPWVGAIAAALLVSSPTFLTMQQQVMSDVPVAAFFTASTAAALSGTHPWLAGAAAGAGVLTRPNLVPLVAIPFLVMLAGQGGMRRAAAFTVPVGVACLVVAALNWRYHGSPLISGYGPLSAMYSLASVGPNLAQYTRWFVQLHSPLVLLAPLALLVARPPRWRVALVTLGMALGALALYAPFIVFHENDWGYTRFLLPGYPGWFVAFGILVTAAPLVRRWRAPAVIIAATLVGIVAVHGWRVALRDGVFLQRLGDSRFAWAVGYARTLPERSILVSNAHSGTLRFYTGRDVLRFEAIRPGEFDTAAAHLRRQGYTLFLIGDEFEIDQFRTRFAGTHAVTSLLQKPRAASAGVVVYDLP